jgi:hypothetical protein
LRCGSSGEYLDYESNYLLGLGDSGKLEGLLSSCLTRVGILPEEKALIDVHSPISQVLTPDLRLMLLPTDSLLGELQRELGKVTAKKLGLVQALKSVEEEFLVFWQNLPKRLTLSANRKPSSIEPMTMRHLQSKLAKTLALEDRDLVRWSSRKVHVSDLASFGAGLPAAAHGLLYCVSQGLDQNPSLFHFLSMLSLSRTGASFQGGMTRYRELLLNLARRQGAHIPLKTECRRIFIEKGRFMGVQVAGRANMVAAGGGVLGCLFTQAKQRMNISGVSWGMNWKYRRKKPLIPTGWKFTIALSVHPEAIPFGLSPRSVWQEEGAPFLEIEVVNPQIYSGLKCSHTIIYLRTLLPYSKETLEPRYQRLIAARMVRQTMELLPFLEEHMVRIFPDFRRDGSGGHALQLPQAGGPKSASSASRTADVKSDENTTSQEDELVACYHFENLEEIFDHLLVFEGKGIGSNTGIENLYCASAESYPELGSLGPTAAALEAVAWAAHRSGLAGPFV